MKKLSIATAGAALLALGTVSAVPAEAGTLTFDYEAEVSGSVTFNPFLVPFLPTVEQYLGLPSGFIPPSVTFPPYSFTGQFTVLDDPAQYTAGDISLDSTLFSSLYGFSYPASLADTLDSVFNLNFSGIGSVTSNLGTTDFVFDYVSADNSILINQFTDVSVLDGCLVEECVTTAEGNFSLDLVLSGFLAETEEYEIDLPPEVVGLIGFYQQFVGDELNLVTGNVAFEATTIPVGVTTPPVESVPEPSTLLGLFGLGSLFAAKRKLQKSA